MKINKIFSLIVLSMVAAGNSFAAGPNVSIEDTSAYDEAQAKKRFVKAFNEFKKLSPTYPTAEESLKKTRELEDNDGIIISYLLEHPRLLKEEVRTDVLKELGATDEQIERATMKASGKSKNKVKVEDSHDNLDADQKDPDSKNKVKVEDSHAMKEYSVHYNDNDEDHGNMSEHSGPSQFWNSENGEEELSEGQSGEDNDTEEKISQKDASHKNKKSSNEIDTSNIIEGTRKRTRNTFNERIEEAAPKVIRAPKNKKTYADKETQTDQQYREEIEEAAPKVMRAPKNKKTYADKETQTDQQYIEKIEALNSNLDQGVEKNQSSDSGAKKPPVQKKKTLTKLEREMRNLQ